MKIHEVCKQKTLIEQKFLESIYKPIWTGTKFEQAYNTLYPCIDKTVVFPKPQTPVKNGSYDAEKSVIDFGVSKLSIN